METLVNSKYTKEDIAQRIVFTIAKKWQINEKDVAARFDPLMMLLVEVIAQELDAINTQWEMSVEEMTETIIQKFFPKYPIKEYLPHVAVMQAKPLESTAVLPAYFGFQLQQADHTHHFTPIHETRIFNIKQHSIWVNDEPFTQSSGFQAKGGGTVRSIALLCKVSEGLDSLDGLQMYIDTGLQSERAMLLYALQHGACTINGEAVDLKIGCKSSVTSNGDFWTTLQELAFTLYNPNFITFSHKGKKQALSSDHSLWQKLSDKEKKELDASSTVYIKWELPVQLQERWLHQLNIHLNAFVGINRSQSNVQYKLDPFVNVVPLSVDQHLLFVEQMKGDANEPYKALEAATEDSLIDGTFLLKSSNFGKLSSDALSYSIQDLKGQVNSSNAFFANVSNDYIGRNLQEMQRIVYRLEDKMRNAIALKQQMQYLIVKPFRADKFISVDYWTFDNRNLDKLRVETIWDSKGSLVEKGSALLVSKPYPLASSYKNTLGKPLHQIVSKNDILNLAQNVFGSNLDSIDIRRLYQSASNVHQNKRLTLVIDIRLKSTYNMDYAVLDNNRIQYEMERNSLLSYPFSINIIHS